MTNADVRHFAIRRGMQRGRADAAWGSIYRPLLDSRPIACTIIRSCKPARFWPMWFLLCIYGPHMRDAYRIGYMQGRAEWELANRARRGMVYRVRTSKVTP